MPTYQSDVTDQDQSKREEAQFEGGAPVFDDAKTRVVPKGAQTAPLKTANSGSTIRSNAGVVMPHDDAPGRMAEETQGKA